MSKQRDWQNAAVVITGGGSGLGAAVAQTLAAAGARLLLVGRDQHKLRRSCEQAGAQQSAWLAGDVGDAGFCEAVLEKAQALFGRLEVLVNNAGVIHRAAAAQTSDEAWAQTMRTNLDGVFYLSRGAARCMRQGGAIVNVASTVGLTGAGGLAAYCASKGGVVQLTRAMALECAVGGVTVNAVCPGAIDTPMLLSGRPPDAREDEVRAANVAAIPQKRLATAAEVARAVMFLAAEPHITGALLPVDGGYTAQ